MPTEKGGRADKAGNEYEKDCIIFEFLKIISEKNYSVTIEALGDDEKGTDILVVRKDGTIEHQQCKKRNASMGYWRFSDLKEKDILKNWRIQLERDRNRYVALVSPVQCTFLVDLHERACNTNRRPRDFYTYQIEKCDQKFKRFYENLCEEMGIDWTSEYGLAKSIDFLKRMNVKQMSEYALEESIQQGISYYFRTNPTNVYDALLGYIEKGNILGKEITILTLRELFVKKNIEMRLLDGDKRIAPQIDRLNKEYRSYFRPLKEGLIERNEFKECIDCIREEQSFIISGNAGSGKSGCTEAVLDYCEKEKIPYLAIKLDRRIPHGSCEEWGKKLGFQGSVSYAIDAVSKNQTGIIILDQLDALRWTQANSSEAIQICIDLINQVTYINKYRKHKLIMVLVCREYDLKNDNNIKLLFQSREDESEEQKEKWKKISIKNFDDTLVKEIDSCSENTLENFAETLVRFQSPHAIERYQYRIDQNKEKNSEPVYWSFWGELQYELLPYLPLERLEKKYQDLYRVLKRRFEGIESFYINGSSHSGNVSSPVAGKEIGIHQWKQIITNKKLIGKRRTRWKETEEGFTESSLQTFAESFRYMVRTNPIETIEMVLNNQEAVLPVFGDTVYNGVADSECIDMIQMETWERLFMEIPYNRTRDREICFCRIIENVKNDQWSDWILNQLIYLSVLEKETTQDIICRSAEKKDLQTLKTLALNTVRGRSLNAIGHLLWSRKDLLDRFRDTIDRAVTDSEAFIRMAAFEALWPAYNIDRDWAEVRILSIYESDVRMAGRRDSKGMFFRLYPKYRERILQVIRNCLDTEEKELIQVGMYTVCEFYIQYNEFEDVLAHLEDYSEEHWRALLHMAVLYLENENWREKGKKVILRCKQLYIDMEYPVGGIFDKGRIDLKRDSDFLIEIMRSNIGRRTVYSFVRYLEKNACSLKDYAEIIIALCENLLTEELKENPKQLGIANDLSKLIIALYDETANSGLEKNKQIAERCLELWDIMFEKQIGQVRDLSRELMER